MTNGHPHPFTAHVCGLAKSQGIWSRSFRTHSYQSLLQESASSARANKSRSWKGNVGLSCRSRLQVGAGCSVKS